MRKVIIIGSGVSGIVCGICAKRNDNQVIVLEKNNKSLKKLLITGNGKCNYFNDDFGIFHFYSSSDSLSKFFDVDCKNMVLSFFSSIGVVPKVKSGYYYPNSGQSYSVYNSLISEASVRGVSIINDCNVFSIVKDGSKFLVSTSTGEFIADNVVISTGGKSYPKTGSTGDGYSFASCFGHSIVPLFPALVGVVSSDKLRDLSGVRCDARVSLYAGDFVKSEVGEVQFTDYGISGICVYNLSIFVNKYLSLGNSVFIKVNFFDGFCDSVDGFISLINDMDSVVSRNVSLLFESYLNYKIVNFILKLCGIDGDSSWSDLSISKKRLLASKFIDFSINVTGTKDFDVAQVTIGGVNLDEVNDSFESILVPGLYITGEVLDVIGDCGGYNIGFAVLSGIIAGNSIGGLHD